VSNNAKEGVDEGEGEGEGAIGELEIIIACY